MIAKLGEKTLLVAAEWKWKTFHPQISYSDLSENKRYFFPQTTK